MDYSDVDHRLAAIGKELEKNPADWEAWSAKAEILFSLDMNEAAVRCCDKSLALNPNNVLALISKGKVLKRLGRDDEADRCHGRAIELGPFLPNKCIRSEE